MAKKCAAKWCFDRLCLVSFHQIKQGKYSKFRQCSEHFFWNSITPMRKSSIVGILCPNTILYSTLEWSPSNFFPFIFQAWLCRTSGQVYYLRLNYGKLRFFVNNFSTKGRWCTKLLRNLRKYAGFGPINAVLGGTNIQGLILFGNFQRQENQNSGSGKFYGFPKKDVTPCPIIK